MSDEHLDMVHQMIRDGFQQVNNRLDQHYDLFMEHSQDDKKAWRKLDDLDREVTVAKRVSYILGTAATMVAGWLGYSR